MRNSNIELLRVISIILIVTMHLCVPFRQNAEIQDKIIISLVNAIGNTGVTIFVLISGYYGIKKNISKILMLANVTLFWSLFDLTINFDNLGLKDIVKCIFPIITGNYWFISCYIILSILAPLLNFSDKLQLKKTILILLLFYVISPSFIGLELLHDSGKGIINMFLIYLIGRYIQLYGIPSKFSRYLGGGGILFISITILNFIFILNGIPMLFARDNNILIILLSLCIFNWFIKRPIYSSNLINYLSSYCLSIYLVHSTLLPITYRYIINFQLGISWLIIICLLLCFISIIMEKLRFMLLNRFFSTMIKLEEKSILKLWNKIDKITA